MKRWCPQLLGGLNWLCGTWQAECPREQRWVGGRCQCWRRPSPRHRPPRGPRPNQQLAADGCLSPCPFVPPNCLFFSRRAGARQAVQGAALLRAHLLQQALRQGAAGKLLSVWLRAALVGIAWRAVSRPRLQREDASTRAALRRYVGGRIWGTRLACLGKHTSLLDMPCPLSLSRPQPQGESAVVLGAGMDELLRHVPQLRPGGLRFLLATLGSFCSFAWPLPGQVGTWLRRRLRCCGAVALAAAAACQRAAAAFANCVDLCHALARGPCESWALGKGMAGHLAVLRSSGPLGARQPSGLSRRRPNVWSGSETLPQGQPAGAGAVEREPALSAVGAVHAAEHPGIHAAWNLDDQLHAAPLSGWRGRPAHRAPGNPSCMDPDDQLHAAPLSGRRGLPAHRACRAQPGRRASFAGVFPQDVTAAPLAAAQALHRTMCGV